MQYITESEINAIKVDPNLWRFIRERLNCLSNRTNDNYQQKLIQMQIACYLQKYPEMIELYKDYITIHISIAHVDNYPIDIINNLNANKTLWWNAPIKLFAIFQTLILQDSLPNVAHATYLSIIEKIIIENNKLNELIAARDNTQDAVEKEQIIIIYNEALKKYEYAIDELITNLSDCLYEEIKDNEIAPLVTHIISSN